MTHYHELVFEQYREPRPGSLGVDQVTLPTTVADHKYIYSSIKKHCYEKERIKFSMAALAFSIALAVAFAFQKPPANNMRFGKHIDNQGNVTWVDVTGQTAVADYECQNAQEVCTAELENDDPNLGEPIPGTETAGRFAQ